MSTEAITDKDRAYAMASAFAAAEAHCKLSDIGLLGIKERARRILQAAHHHVLEPQLYRAIYWVAENVG
jgi:hypothetical protein